MTTEKDSYRQIFKSTSIFGGLQVFNILISILKKYILFDAQGWTKFPENNKKSALFNQDMEMFIIRIFI